MDDFASSSSDGQKPQWVLRRKNASTDHNRTMCDCIRRPMFTVETSRRWYSLSDYCMQMPISLCARSAHVSTTDLQERLILDKNIKGVFPTKSRR